VIVSYEHNYLFLHARKAAGTFFKLNSYGWLGPQDVALGAWKSVLSAGILPNEILLRTLFTSDVVEKKQKRFIGGQTRFSTLEAIDRAAKRVAVLSGLPPQTHPTAQNVRESLGSKWGDLEKVAVVRNTYERAVSDYLWRLSKSKWRKPSLRMYLELIKNGYSLAGLISPAHDTWCSYAIDGEFVIDRVIRYENLVEDLSVFLLSRGQSGSPFLATKVNANTKKPSQDWKNLVGKKEEALIQEIYGLELDYFGFEL
jgi:hypothetical protein